MRFLKKNKTYIILILMALLGCLFIALKDGFNNAIEVFIYIFLGCTFLIVGNFLLQSKK